MLQGLAIQRLHEVELGALGRGAVFGLRRLLTLRGAIGRKEAPMRVPW